MLPFFDSIKSETWFATANWCCWLYAIWTNKFLNTILGSIPAHFAAIGFYDFFKHPIQSEVPDFGMFRDLVSNLEERKPEIDALIQDLQKDPRYDEAISSFLGN